MVTDASLNQNTILRGHKEAHDQALRGHVYCEVALNKVHFDLDERDPSKDPEVHPFNVA
jgi:hypothetical protein